MARQVRDYETEIYDLKREVQTLRDRVKDLELWSGRALILVHPDGYVEVRVSGHMPVKLVEVPDGYLPEEEECVVRKMLPPHWKTVFDSGRLSCNGLPNAMPLEDRMQEVTAWTVLKALELRGSRGRRRNSSISCKESKSAVAKAGK